MNLKEALKILLDNDEEEIIKLYESHKLFEECDRIEMIKNILEYIFCKDCKNSSNQILNNIPHFDRTGIRYTYDVHYDTDYFKSKKVSYISVALQHELNDIAKFFIDLREPLDDFDNYWMSPLYYALEVSNWKMFEYLVKSGCNVNIRDNESNDPIFFELIEPHFWQEDIIKLMIDNGLDTSICRDNCILDIIKSQERLKFIDNLIIYKHNIIKLTGVKNPKNFIKYNDNILTIMKINNYYNDYMPLPRELINNIIGYIVR